MSSPISPGDRFSYTVPLTVAPTIWTSAGLTLTLGIDGDLHVYRTGTTTDVISPCPPTCVANINITSPSSSPDNLSINSTGNPIPAGRLTYSGAAAL